VDVDKMQVVVVVEVVIEMVEVFTLEATGQI
jgi:hypothetical protein